MSCFELNRKRNAVTSHDDTPYDFNSVMLFTAAQGEKRAASRFYISNHGDVKT